MIALPTPCQPKPIAEALEVLEARERDLLELEQELRSARVGLDEARATDRAEYARRRDAGEDGAGPVHLERARAHLEDVERRHSGEALRVEQAQARLEAALSENVDAWRTAVESALGRADVASARALDKLERAESERAELRGARAWLRGSSGAPKPGSPVPTSLRRNLNSPETYTVVELVAALRDGIANTSLDAQRRRDAQHAELELAAEQRREQRRRLHDRAVAAPD